MEGPIKHQFKQKLQIERDEYAVDFFLVDLHHKAALTELFPCRFVDNGVSAACLLCLIFSRCLTATGESALVS